MIDVKALKSWPFQPVEQRYGWKETVLYALGLGLGQDPTDPMQLRHVYEDGLVALPTMAVVLGHPGFFVKDPRTGIDWVKVLHGEQELELHAPLPAQATVIGRTRVAWISDKGAGKGATMGVERELVDAAGGTRLATLRMVTFMRGDGGFSAAGQPSDPSPAARPATPDGPPDLVDEWRTRPESALVYRLSGDDNPLHADPAVARAAGFERPILHGLCSFGVAGWSLARAVTGGDASRLRSIGLRFAAPVYPGETLRTEIWRGEGGTVRFRTRVLERDLVVLSHGSARFD